MGFFTLRRFFFIRKLLLNKKKLFGEGLWMSDGMKAFRELWIEQHFEGFFVNLLLIV